MAATIIDGKKVSESMRAELQKEVEALVAQGVQPHLATVLIGENPASQVYVGLKGKSCRKLGMNSSDIRLAADTGQEEVMQLIRRLNEDPSVHGILVQLPLPKHLDSSAILEALDPRKDVDGFHPINVGRLQQGLPCFRPCTPAGIMELFRHYAIPIKGQEAVVVGRSNIVGKPMAIMLLEQHATVTICHTRTRDLGEVTRRADILVVASGRPRMLHGSQVKSGATVIDVGVNRLEDGSLVGDVDFESAREVAGAITPVPGGVGPMTVTMLLYNTVAAARMASGKSQVAVGD